MNVETHTSSSSPEEVWTKLFDTLCERIGPCFTRPETRAGVKAYLRGLLSPIERKNGWQLAEEAGLSTPYSMQYLLNRAVWDSDAVREQLQGYVRERIAGPDGMLVIDAHGLSQKGEAVGGRAAAIQWHRRTRFPTARSGSF